MPILAVALRADLGCGTGHSCFVISSSFARQTIAQIELITKPYEYMVGKVDVMQTELKDEQAAYIGASKAGPDKANTYRY